MASRGKLLVQAALKNFVEKSTKQPEEAINENTDDYNKNPVIEHKSNLGEINNKQSNKVCEEEVDDSNKDSQYEENSNLAIINTNYLQESFDKDVNNTLEEENSSLTKTNGNEKEESFDEDVDDSDKDPLYEESCSDTESSSASTSVESESHNSETLDNDNNDSVERKGKKRIARPTEWLKKKAKLLRDSGQAYTSASRGKKIEARKLRKPCSETCRLKCSSKIGENVRQLIFDKYWGLKNLSRQRDFISKNMSTIQPSYRYTKTETGRRKNHAFYFEVENQRIRVCKFFFKSTLDINDRPIRTVIAKNDAGFVSEDGRGKHGHHKKVDPVIKDGVRKHINSIPRIESHYLRQQTTREFIDGGKTLTDLFNDYKTDCINNGLPHANLVMYSRIFNSEFNISFFVPKKDRCELCVAYENCEGEDKEALHEKYIQHQQEKVLSRTEKQKDKDNVNKNFVVACYDLQAVLPVPRGEISVYYYKSKLNSYNFTISEMKSDRVECYFWHEGLGKRGANEIGTCLYKYLEKTANAVNSDDLEVVLYSDNCCGQQKNRFIFSLYMYAVTTLRIKAITHKFLIKGHTQNEGDTVHSVIEKSVKRSLKSGPIHVPSHYVTLIRTAKKKGSPYNVTEMGYEDFFNLKDLCEQYENNFAKALTEHKIKDIKIIRFEKNNPNKFYYKTSYSNTEYTEIEAKRTRASKQTKEEKVLKPAYTTKLSITDKKKADLLSLLNSNHIPKCYGIFYNSL